MDVALRRPRISRPGLQALRGRRSAASLRFASGARFPERQSLQTSSCFQPPHDGGRWLRCDIFLCRSAMVSGCVIGTHHQNGGQGLREERLLVGKTANHIPSQVGITLTSHGISVREIQWANCISCACSPTITSNTTPSSTPVVISIFRYGRRCWRTNVSTATIRRKRETEERAFQNDPGAQAQVVALQKQHHFKSFAIKRGESQQDQTPPQTASGRSRSDFCEERFPPAVVRPNPAAPINLCGKTSS